MTGPITRFFLHQGLNQDSNQHYDAQVMNFMDDFSFIYDNSSIVFMVSTFHIRKFTIDYVLCVYVEKQESYKLKTNTHCSLSISQCWLSHVFCFFPFLFASVLLLILAIQHMLNMILFLLIVNCVSSKS